MCSSLGEILSRNCGAFWQFVKYGVIGVMATGVQAAVFYALAATCLKCLKPTDWAARLLRLPGCDVSDATRARRFFWATAVGFTVANVFCWLMNRYFVFEPGLHAWYVEFAMFYAAAGVAMLVATSVSGMLIGRFGMMTTLAVVLEVVVSFMFNFFLRKFVIFKG